MNDESANKATILLFVALPEEHDRLLEFFPPLDTFVDNEFVFVDHDLEDKGVRMVSVLATGMGIDNAYDATTAGIGRFEPDLVVCLGIAGSLTQDLKIGDVSVSSEIIDISQNMKILDVAPTRNRRPTRRRKTQAPQERWPGWSEQGSATAKWIVCRVFPRTADMGCHAGRA